MTESAARLIDFAHFQTCHVNEFGARSKRFDAEMLRLANFLIQWGV